MINFLLAILAGGFVCLLLALPGWLRWVEASVPALLSIIGVYIVLARRSFAKLQELAKTSMLHVQKQPPNIAQAIRELKTAYPLQRYQWGIATQIDHQLGILYFMQGDQHKASLALERSYRFGHWMGGAMLATIYYRRKEHAKLEKLLSYLTTANQKVGFLWSLSGFFLVQIGKKDQALITLAQGSKYVGNDERLQAAYLAVQNGQKIKMRGYREIWYQLGLEKIPNAMRPQGQAMHIGKVARRGRWS